MRKISVLFAAIFTVLSLQVSAQGVFKFEEETFDFGQVKEGETATHQFKFTNTGDAPIVLSQVRASCGCTTPSWTKEPVAPGQTGVITAAYNSAGRPGAFNKTITVLSNAKEASKVITIKGVVEPKPKVVRQLTEEEKATSARLTFDASNVYDFGKIEKGQRVSYKLPIKNTGGSDLTITSVKSNCNCVTQKTSKQSIKPGETATIELLYAPRAFGERDEVVTIYSTDLVEPARTVTLKANIVDSLTLQSPVKEGGNSVPFK